MVVNHEITPPSVEDTIGVEHHHERIDGRMLHWVTAGETGSPILLVHGFPETWAVFRHLIPLLSASHRVIAVDLPGFGDSGSEPGDYSIGRTADAMHALIARLDLGPVHLSVQDISGGVGVQVAATHPDDLLSLIAIETMVPGFGFEALADVAHGGAWHVGAIATPGAAEFIFAGRVREYLAERWFPFLTRVPGSVTEDDLREFTRAYSRDGAWNGPQGLYASSIRGGDAFRELVSAGRLRTPMLAVDGMERTSTALAMRPIAESISSVLLDGVGHHVALEAPGRLATAMLGFLRDVEAIRPDLVTPGTRRGRVMPDARGRSTVRVPAVSRSSPFVGPESPTRRSGTRRR